MQRQIIYYYLVVLVERSKLFVKPTITAIRITNEISITSLLSLVLFCILIKIIKKGRNKLAVLIWDKYVEQVYPFVARTLFAHLCIMRSSIKLVNYTQGYFHVLIKNAHILFTLSIDINIRSNEWMAITKKRNQHHETYLNYLW